ncbi:hypothetical protein BFJ72_g5615 [Fusarium proliferatum]|uniref:Uncharacterized protein n=1 Tax=Gibberella intermedia TaxID=948311 RepID=A0A420TI11_GIBIN|nr:hypothetical protein BFJ72_g5615 [Fusarium proliferatum]
MVSRQIFKAYQEEASFSVSNYSLDFGFTLRIFDSGSTVAQLCSDADHTPQQGKKEAKQKIPPSGPQGSGKSTKRPAESSSVPHKKSRRAKSHNDLEEPDGDDGSGDEKKEETFACPFYRKDPVRFLECMNIRLVSIPIVKQHLKRRHTANPDPDGSACQEDLTFSTMSEDHDTEVSCAQGSTDDLNIIPPKILDALKRRSNRRMSPTDQWHEIWVILFGESDVTPKPLLEGVVKEMTSIIRDIWSKDGGQIVSKHVQARGMPACPDQLLSLLPDLLDSVEDRFGNEQARETLSRQIADTQESAMKMTTKEICICHQDSGNPFQTSYYIPEMSRYTPISPSASFTRDSSTPLFGVETFDDPFQTPYHMPNLSNYTPISTSASLTRDSLAPLYGAGNSDDLRLVGGVFDSQAVPLAYPLTDFPSYLEPVNGRGMWNSVSDPGGVIGRLAAAKVEMIEPQQNGLELQNNYRDNHAGNSEPGFGPSSIYR